MSPTGIYTRILLVAKGSDDRNRLRLVPQVNVRVLHGEG